MRLIINKTFSEPLSKLCKLGFGVILLSLPITHHAQIFSSDTGYAEVKGTTPMSSYTGKSHDLHGRINLESKHVKFHLPLETIKTGNSTRDRHMREALETDQFPKAKFSGQIVGDFPEQGESGEVQVKGIFTIHGVTKTIEVTGTINHSPDAIRVKAAFPIKITQYDIERPGFLFVSVHDKHRIKIRTTLNEMKP